MADSKGFLTSTDREFLRGKKEYDSKQSRYDRRQAIRERTRAAFHDFSLLYETLDRSERNKIFAPADESHSLFRAMIDTMAFLYHALEGDVDSNQAHQHPFPYPFDQLLRTGVRHGEISRHASATGGSWGGHVDVDFSVEIQEPHKTDHERVIEDLAKNEGRGLTERELRTAVAHAARVTASDEEPWVTDDGEPVEEVNLHRLADAVEQKAEELRAAEADKADEDS